MDAETITLRDGDIYRWSYRELGDDRQYGRYHCCSRIAVVQAGRLRDTYWSGPSSESRSFGTGDLERLELTFVANFADLEKADERQADYYDDADVVNLNHSNSTRGNFYLRKGARRSAAKMLEIACYKLECEEAAERSATQAQERLRKAIFEIKAGNTSVYL